MEIRDTKRKGFSIVHNEIVDQYAREIGGNGVMVYLFLARHVDNQSQSVSVTRKAIAETLGISSPTVSRTVAKLEELGLISRSTTRGEVTIFTLLKVGGPLSPVITPLITSDHTPDQNLPYPLSPVITPLITSDHTQGKNFTLPYKEDQTKKKTKLEENSSRPRAREELTSSGVGETSYSSEAERLMMAGVPEYLAPIAGRLAETYRKATDRTLRWSYTFTQSLMSRYQEYAQSGEDPSAIADVWEWLWTTDGDGAWHRENGALSVGGYLDPVKHDQHIERFRSVGSQRKETPEEERARLDKWWDEYERKEKEREQRENAESGRLLSNVG